MIQWKFLKKSFDFLQKNVNRRENGYSLKGDNSFSDKLELLEKYTLDKNWNFEGMQQINRPKYSKIHNFIKMRKWQLNV